MPEDSQEGRPELEDEDGGGPVKSFLEHLEDLRWTIIKSAVAIFVGMIICLSAGNTIMRIMEWPLERAARANPGKSPYLRLEIGTNVIGTFRLDTNRFGPLDLGSNQLTALQLVPYQPPASTNWLLTLQPSTNAATEILPASRIKLLNLHPAGGFVIAFELAIYGGITLASPFVIYYVAQFVLPALKRKEKKYVFRGFGIGTGLFLGGVTFCYFVLLPLALLASQKYSEWLGISADQWQAPDYISFVSKFMLGMGLGFELPVVLLVLVKIGILDYQKLAAFRKYMIVINLVLGAVLTTPEVLTQIMMALPLQVLYEITVWIAWYWERQEKKRQPAEDSAST